MVAQHGSGTGGGGLPALTYKDITSQKITVSACLVGIVTIFSCYLVSLSEGVVPAWLPMISDCFVYPPASYISRIGIISTAILLYINAAMFWFYVQEPTFGGRKVDDFLTLFLGSIACFGLAVVGAVNEDENTTLHGAGAIIFFAGYIMFMGLTTQRLARSSHTVNPQSLRVKKLLFFTSVALFIAFALMSGNWGKYGIYIAMAEWTGTIFILLFNMSFIWEFGTNEKIAYVEVDPTPSTSAPVSAV